MSVRAVKALYYIVVYRCVVKGKGDVAILDYSCINERMAMHYVLVHSSPEHYNHFLCPPKSRRYRTSSNVSLLNKAG